MTDAIRDDLGQEASAAIRALMARHARPGLAATLGSRPPATARASALGGPAWRQAPDTPWPVDHRGVAMMHLARIDISAVPALEGFPARGIVQIFISTEDFVFGADQPQGEGYVVEWWPDPAEGVAVAQPPFDDDDLEEGTPLVGSVAGGTVHALGQALAFERADIPAGADHPEVESALCEALGAGANSRAMHRAREALAEGRPAVAIGGWPHGVQRGVQRGVQQGVAMDDHTVLLQIGDGHCDDVMWGGDIGTATFLIPAADLAAQRFDRVRYSASGY
ncbi:MAG: YwqG family protein [Pseudomonadota bacterium]